MGFFGKLMDKLTSTARPEPGTTVLGIEELKQRILTVNRPTAPFTIQPGTNEGADFVAEWKIVDSQ
ncbi:MAG: hypothetical protein ACD_28C00105G0002 [uncultured bacterium]|nr:MAG: hypothetical protein ACD_28C00105G0002 [uncultured bacterium]KKT74168.1 MAG: hypothetical protein UW70_C0064G0004 [Candidatus Peregrinibacteria bacterium GW2011_GWA2_44_7]